MLRKARRAVIGVDFDNTLIGYDDLMVREAFDRGFLTPAAGSAPRPPESAAPQVPARLAAPAGGRLKSKKAIRDEIRALPDGEQKWRSLQAAVYGPGIGAAKIIPGVRRFFELCKDRGVDVYIVSHKTEFAGRDVTGTNLRTAALTWMKKNKFFENKGMGLLEASVFFESTRRKKLQRISRLKCTHFVDDMEETFLEPLFPKNVEKILFYPHDPPPALDPAVRLARTWRQIGDYFFRG